MLVQQVGTATPVPVTTPFSITSNMGVPSTVTPTAEGFCPYYNSTQNLDNTLAYWESSGDALFYVWLEIADTSYNVLGATPPYLIQLDNTAPAAVIHIDDGGDCKQFAVGGPAINGHFVRHRPELRLVQPRHHAGDAEPQRAVHADAERPAHRAAARRCVVAGPHRHAGLRLRGAALGLRPVDRG